MVGFFASPGRVLIDPVERSRSGAAKVVIVFVKVCLFWMVRQIAFELVPATFAAGAFDIAFQFPELALLRVHGSLLSPLPLGERGGAT